MISFAISEAESYFQVMQCSLCENKIQDPYFFDDRKSWTYWRCQQCDIVFRDPQSYLNHMQERARYQTHNNCIEDEGYTRFLNPVVQMVLKYVPAGARGLDFGCGPGPTLSELIRRQGYECVDYDPFFRQENQLLETKYDFVTCTEVVEHFYHPKKEFNKIDRVLKRGGHFIVMTDNRREEREFANWGYRHDPTHVCFFNENSWQFVADRWQWQLLAVGPRVTVFKK